MNIFKYYIMVLQILIHVNSVAKINDNSVHVSYKNIISDLDTTYFVKESFSTWKEFVFARNNTIFCFERESIVYKNNVRANANEMFNFNLDLYRLDKFDNLKKIGNDGPNSRPIHYNLKDKIVRVENLAPLILDQKFKNYLPTNCKIVSIIKDTTKNNIPRFSISWVDYKKNTEWGWIFDTSCGLAIFEFYEDWKLMYLHEIKDCVWQETKIYDMNQSGFKEIIFKYASLGGSGFTYYLKLIQRN